MPLKTKTIDRSIGGQPTKWTTYQRTAGGQYAYYGVGNGTSRQYKRDILTRNWYTLPGWKEFRAKYGYLPTQGMNESHDFVSQELFVPTYFCYGGQYRVDMSTPDPVYVPSYSGYIGQPNQSMVYSTLELAALRLDAKNKALSRARDMKVNVAVMLGEGRSTVAMLANTVRTLGKAYRNFRRGRFRRAAKDLGITKPTGDAAQHWLAYQLGWMPLLSDAEGLIELSKNGLITRYDHLGNQIKGPRFTVKANSSVEQKTAKWSVVGQGASNLPGGETAYTAQVVAKGKAGLLLEFKTSYDGLASVGLGKFDFVGLAWELIPFSFVFDYFIEVGKYLESISSLEGLTVLAGFESHEEWSYGTATLVKPETNGWVAGVRPRANFTWRSYYRENWMGQVTLRKPIFDALNGKRLTNMAALWRQRTMGDRNGGYRP